MSTMTLDREDQAAVLPPEDRDDPPGPDPDAPYGRNAAGKPYKRPAETRAKLAEALQTARASRGPQKAPQRNRRPNRASGSAGAAKSPSVDYRAAAAGILGLFELGFALAGKVTGSTPLVLDAATIHIYTPDAAEVLDEAARESEWIASVLEKAMMVGPYGKAAVLVFGMGAQLAANHGLIPPSPDAGVLDPEALMGRLNESAR